jgi:hypothetical protein
MVEIQQVGSVRYSRVLCYVKRPLTSAHQIIKSYDTQGRLKALYPRSPGMFDSTP